MANGGSGIKGKFNERLTNIRMGKLRKKKLNSIIRIIKHSCTYQMKLLIC